MAGDGKDLTGFFFFGGGGGESNINFLSCHWTVLFTWSDYREQLSGKQNARIRHSPLREANPAPNEFVSRDGL